MRSALTLLKKYFLPTGILILMAMCVICPLRFVPVSGVSMTPNLYNKDIALVWYQDIHNASQLTRQQVVLLNIQGSLYFKRIIGLPGDFVEVSDEGKVALNGIPLDEPYALFSNDGPSPSGTWHIPSGDMFVMGDDRDVSSDSRYWGAIPVSDVQGFVMMRLLGLTPWKAEIIQ